MAGVPTASVFGPYWLTAGRRGPWPSTSTSASVAVRAGVRTCVSPTKVMRWPSIVGDLAGPQRHLAAVAERGGRRQGHGDHHHAEVHHHAAVGPPHEPAPRPAPLRRAPRADSTSWRTLAAAANPPRPKASSGAEAPHADRHAADHHQHADPRPARSGGRRNVPPSSCATAGPARPP